MYTEKYEEELFSCLEEYADFLARMAKDEDEKLQALVSNSLPRIERAISVAQANAKQLESFELKRIRLQEQAGYGNMTFSEMIESAPEEERQSLEALLWRIQEYVDRIKYTNSKSMKVARVNMKEIDPAAEVPGAVHSPASDAYRKARERINGDKTMLLKAKI